MNELSVQKAAEYLHPEQWWEWQIPVYLFLGGLAAGLMVLTALRVARDPLSERSAAFRLAAWLAPAVLSLGMLCLWLDLERRWNVPRFYLSFQPRSPMSWGAWILLAVYPFALLHALLELPAGMRHRLPAFLRRLAPRVEDVPFRRRLAWANAGLGAALGVYTGVLLSAMAARPLWNSAVLGPLFLVSGLSTGAALLMLFRIGRRERHVLGRMDAGLIGVELALIGLFLLTLVTGGAAQQAAGRLLLGGMYTAAFWSLVVTAGLVLPLLSEILEIRGGQGSRWFVPALVLMGGLALRWILVSAGQTNLWAGL